MNNAFLILVMGVVLGLKHAIEADHILAVTTLSTQFKNPFKSALVGAFWGIGHTTTLFLVGMVVLLLNIVIPPKLTLFFEMMVGVMLIILGIRALRTKPPLHQHTHVHDGAEHVHIHTVEHHEKYKSSYKKRSFVVGMVHGIAGSGALMILILSTIQSTALGLVYIVLFGIGSILGMGIMSFFVGLPVYFSASKFNRLEKWIRYTAGSFSILFGIYLVYEIGIKEGLFRI